MSDRLLNTYDALLLDLDGTVYRGDQALPGAEDVARLAHEGGVTIRFVTNNASRGPDEVARHLADLGVPAEPVEVSTSSQAAGSVLAANLPAGADVLVVGTTALMDVVSGVGLRPVRQFSGSVAGVVQGLNQDATWRDLAEACLAIRAGAFWVACNVDATLPTERGQLPGNGAMVAALRTATGKEPVVAGKPARPLLDEAVRSAGAQRPLFVGDRLDTDIAGAEAAGIDAMFVLTGVSTPAELLAAPQRLRPRYVAADLRAVRCSVSELEIRPQPSWDVRTRDQGLTVRWTGVEGDEVSLLRALCAAHAPADGAPIEVHAEDDRARQAIGALDLSPADQR